MANMTMVNDLPALLGGTPVNDRPLPVIVHIHGGAGTIKKENMTPEQEVAYREKLQEIRDAKTSYRISKETQASRIRGDIANQCSISALCTVEV